MENGWNPWHGCHKYSEGCLHCYVFRIDTRIERDSRVVSKNKDFDFPVRKKRNGEYKLEPGSEVYTCFSSDFFLEEADDWRRQAWDLIRQRPDVRFTIFTKRILRFKESLPEDWGEGYENVTIGCTCENQKRADERLPYFLSLPIRHRVIVSEPLLEEIHLEPYLDPSKIELVTVGGESGEDARLCDYDWVKSIALQCKETGIPFHFHQTGERFRKDGRIYTVPRRFQHSQARKSGLSTTD